MNSKPGALVCLRGSHCWKSQENLSTLQFVDGKCDSVTKYMCVYSKNEKIELTNHAVPKKRWLHFPHLTCNKLSILFPKSNIFYTSRLTFVNLNSCCLAKNKQIHNVKQLTTLKPYHGLLCELNHPQKGSLSPKLSPLSVGNVMHMPLSVLRPTNSQSIAGLEK